MLINFIIEMNRNDFIIGMYWNDLIVGINVD